MRFTNQGLAIWYGTVDAPAPTSGETLPPDGEIMIGVSPAQPSNQVVVTYRVDQGVPRSVNATLVSTDYIQQRQYFRVSFANLLPGSRVDYLPVLKCAGRQAPDVQTSSTLLSRCCVMATLKEDHREQTKQNAIHKTHTPEFPFRIEHLFRLDIDIINVVIIGGTPDGVQIAWNSLHGEVTGEHISANIRNVGGSSMIVHPNGLGEIHGRFCASTDDGALIGSITPYFLDFGRRGYEQLQARTMPDRTPFRGAPLFMTASPKYVWLNRLQGLVNGSIDLKNNHISYDAYVVILDRSEENVHNRVYRSVQEGSMHGAG